MNTTIILDGEPCALFNYYGKAKRCRVAYETTIDGVPVDCRSAKVSTSKAHADRAHRSEYAYLVIKEWNDVLVLRRI